MDDLSIVKLVRELRWQLQSVCRIFCFYSPSLWLHLMWQSALRQQLVLVSSSSKYSKNWNLIYLFFIVLKAFLGIANNSTSANSTSTNSTSSFNGLMNMNYTMMANLTSLVLQIAEIMQTQLNQTSSNNSTIR